MMIRRRPWRLWATCESIETTRPDSKWRTYKPGDVKYWLSLRRRTVELTREQWETLR